jgi:hypothetical protein
MRKELQDELKRRKIKLKRDTARKAKAVRRALKFEEKRAAMEVLGIVIEEKDVADELDKDLNEEPESQDEEDNPDSTSFNYHKTGPSEWNY